MTLSPSRHNKSIRFNINDSKDILRVINMTLKYIMRLQLSYPMFNTEYFPDHVNLKFI